MNIPPLKRPKLCASVAPRLVPLLLATLCWPLVGAASDAPAPAAAPAAAPAIADAGNGSKQLAAAIAARHAEKSADGAAAKPAAADKTAAAKAPPAPPDPMAALREKLALKLGATKAPEAPSPNVVRVVAKADAHSAEPARPGAHGAGLVAKLQAEKGKATGHATGRSPAAKAGHGGHVHWGYKGEGGPEEWGALKAEYAKCATGNRQSPIDIRGGVKVDLDPVQFDYRPSGFWVVDNGHTVQVNLASGNSIEVMGRRYELLQFHFHRPSEERIDGRQFDMSAHLVHRDPEGRLAVVGVLLDRGSAHGLVQTVWNNLPLERNTEVPAQVLIDPNHLLPADRRYFTYMGSLTTPPCSEGVLWMVMQQPVPVSSEQVAVFSRLYPMNARPIQSAAGRLIKASN